MVWPYPGCKSLLRQYFLLRFPATSRADGWHRRPPPAGRIVASASAVIQVKTLWIQDPASFHGEFYRFESVRCLPHPLQKPHPPIWVGGHSKLALRRVARLGDGWHPVGANPAVPLRPAELRASLDELYRLTEAEKRDPSKLTISFKAPLYDTGQGVDGGAERRPFSGSPQAITDDIATYARLGVSELIFDFRSESLAESLERMERFAPLVRQTAGV
ncbi:MAG TPA: LLM class flavin-dependent oxidoreductase [Methylomirabilota bacterium]|nr:LLM class flavin-dependent oxidoreductase [Methylomirabilota bacterium]